MSSRHGLGGLEALALTIAAILGVHLEELLCMEMKLPYCIDPTLAKCSVGTAHQAIGHICGSNDKRPVLFARSCTCDYYSHCFWRNGRSTTCDVKPTHQPSVPADIVPRAIVLSSVMQ